MPSQTVPQFDNFDWFIARFTSSTFIGGVVGAAAYLGYGFLFELIAKPSLVQPGAVSLSYGQQCFMISMPLAALLGAGVGASVAFMRRWGGLVASLLTVTVPLFVAFAVTSLWELSFQHYGADPSDGILYTPLLVGSGLCFAWSIAIAILGSIRLFVVRNEHQPCHKTEAHSDGH